MPTQLPFQSTYIALPCTFISLIITSFVAKAMTSPTEKGLTTVIKATCAFVIVLVATTAATKALLRPSADDETESSDDSDTERPNSSHTPPNNHGNMAESCDISADLTPRETKAKRRRLQKQKIYERTERKEEEKRVRGTLMEQLKRRNNELLGTRKEAVVEVVGEGV
jgi:hypothetical protein